MNGDNQCMAREDFFHFQNLECFICNGYSDQCFGDPVCATCHAFFYSNTPPDTQLIVTLQECSSSDSENDDSIELPAESQTSPKVPQQTELTIEDLPLEVLIQMFEYLDDVSLWSLSQVNTKWQRILELHLKPNDWKTFVFQRWPLIEPIESDQNWYRLYTSLIRSSWCFKCIVQMTAQESPLEDLNPVRKHQLRNEIVYMRLVALEGISVVPLDPFLYHWQATIQGPYGSPYEGGHFFLYIQIPSTYPQYPPSVRFLTKIFHPNVSRHGDVNIDCIHHKWTPDLSIGKVLSAIKTLMSCPDHGAHMEPEVGSLYLHDRNEFEEQARIWTECYAVLKLQD